jgi:hypothetical protein
MEASMNKILAAAAACVVFTLPTMASAGDGSAQWRHAARNAQTSADRYYRGDRDRDCDHDGDRDNRRHIRYRYPPRAYPVKYAPVVYRPAPVVYRPAPVIYRPAPVVYRPGPVYRQAPVYQPAPYPVYTNTKPKHHDDNDDALWAAGGFLVGLIVGNNVDLGNH